MAGSAGIPGSGGLACGAALAGAGTITLIGTGALTGSGVLAGQIGSGALTSTGALAGTGSITLTGSGNLASSGSLAGTSSASVPLFVGNALVGINLGTGGWRPWHGFCLDPQCSMIPAGSTAPDGSTSSTVWANQDAQFNAELQACVDLGVGWVRTGVFWAQIERTSGVYDWTLYDYIIGKIRSYGLRFLPAVWGTPLYVSNDPTRTPTSTETTNFFTAFATRYQSQLAGVIEVWNEPDGGHYWNDTIALFTTHVLMPAYSAIKAVSSSIDVLLSPGTYESSFWSTVNSSGGINSFDIAGIHDYGNVAWSSSQGFPALATEMTSLGRSGIPLWCGEEGQTQSTNTVSDSNHTAQLTADIPPLLALTAPYNLMMWYALDDSAPWVCGTGGNGTVAYYGLCNCPTDANGSLTSANFNTLATDVTVKNAYTYLQGLLVKPTGGGGFATTGVLATAAGSITLPGTANMASSPSLAGTGSITLTGTGGFATSATFAGSGTDTLVGTGGFAADSEVPGTGTITLTGAGNLAIDCELLAMTGTGTVVAVGALAGPGTVVLVGAGGTAAAGTLSGSGVNTEIFVVAGSLASAGALSGAGLLTLAASGGFAGAGSLAGLGSVAGTGGVTAGASLSGAGTVVIAGAGGFAGDGEVPGTGLVVNVSAGALSSTGSLAPAPASITLPGADGLASAGALAGTGIVTLGGTGATAGAGALAGLALIVNPGIAALASAGSLAASPGAITLPGAGQFVASASLLPGASSLAANGSLSGGATLTGAGTVMGPLAGVGILVGQGQLAGAGTVVTVILAAGGIVGTASLAGGGTIILPATASLAALAMLTAYGAIPEIPSGGCNPVVFLAMLATASLWRPSEARAIVSLGDLAVGAVSRT
jgi:hypothetical protein